MCGTGVKMPDQLRRNLSYRPPPRPMVLQDHDLALRRESSRLRAVSAEFPLQRAPADDRRPPPSGR